ncbi:hypothetical protein LF65_06920 [Clostridium beijerinckii]|uniref:Uncharacterized protein n=1 Tax=Clostridium beijerinckii TaxID=1520 RepID=A0A140DMK9_CLOBE|nr:hypothetical protein [Clostridium beijerinckii]AMK50504.1 hypothetical protein LF65_06920 [Clostridium beijerinckii]
MKSLKSVILIIITFVMTSILMDISKNSLCIRSNATTRNQVNIGGFVSNINEPYISLVIQGVENIQKNNEIRLNLLSLIQN